MRLERETATLTERVQDLRGRLDDIAPLVRTVIHLEASMTSVRGDLEEVQAVCGSIKRNLEDRDREATLERRSVRAALVGLTGAILASMIAAFATLLASGTIG